MIELFPHFLKTKCQPMAGLSLLMLSGLPGKRHFKPVPRVMWPTPRLYGCRNNNFAGATQSNAENHLSFVDLQTGLTAFGSFLRFRCAKRQAAVCTTADHPENLRI